MRLSYDALGGGSVEKFQMYCQKCKQWIRINRLTDCRKALLIGCKCQTSVSVSSSCCLYSDIEFFTADMQKYSCSCTISLCVLFPWFTVCNLINGNQLSQLSTFTSQSMNKCFFIKPSLECILVNWTHLIYSLVAPARVAWTENDTLQFLVILLYPAAISTTSPFLSALRDCDA